MAWHRSFFDWRSVYDRGPVHRDRTAETDDDGEGFSVARHRWLDWRADRQAEIRARHDDSENGGNEDAPRETADPGGDEARTSPSGAAALPSVGDGLDVDVVVSPAAAADGAIRVEAEDLNLIYYTPQSWAEADASGGTFISLWNWIGKAWGRFDGPEGLYDIHLAYYDENDGNAAARFTIGGDSELIRFDERSGSSLPTAETMRTAMTHESVLLEDGDYFEILAQASGGEYARFDYIDFVPVAVDDPSDPGDPPGAGDPGDPGTPDDPGDPGDGGGSEPDPALEAFEAEVLRLTNDFRVANGRSPLENDARLNAAAEEWSQSMGENDFFAHSSPRQVEEEGYDWRAWGENIAAGYRTPEQVVQGWINSPGHRANMLSANFEEIGVGHHFEANDTGSVNYGHYWTQVFATENGDAFVA